ncbi:hypothetical protein [Amphritea balenae]|uniref:Uncharacterized protein n=1 Tax=Amphritea balenae TaxID=452629 RepID=A0A3P1SNN0_9GAMM|nr:hypothetical protein [Amphritea balenae]RRC98619.1 hypothetical protein EHS89_13490 [Amphritea balenae]GGK66025.1 hypothetical protein GCM10007941_15270 [Amphritea balenae]
MNGFMKIAMAWFTTSLFTALIIFFPEFNLMASNRSFFGYLFYTAITVFLFGIPLGLLFQWRGIRSVAVYGVAGLVAAIVALSFLMGAFPGITVSFSFWFSYMVDFWLIAFAGGAGGIWYGWLTQRLIRYPVDNKAPEDGSLC